MKQNAFLWKKKCERLRITILLFLVGFNIGFANEVHSQGNFLSLNINNGTLKEIFTEIEKQSKYVFFYYDNVLDVNRKVKINVKNKTIEEILKHIFAGTNNSFTIKDRQVFISKDENRVNTVQNAEQQKRKIFKGKVLDDLGEPLAGATVLVVGSTRGVTTDLDGSFEIEVATTDKLKISFLGLGEQVISVGNQQSAIVRLEQKTNELADVLVVGYGRQ